MDALFPRTLADAEKLTDAELAELLNIMALYPGVYITWGRHNTLVETIKRLDRRACESCVSNILEK